MDAITTRDFEKLKGISELHASPDGKLAAFCVTQADVDENCYKTRLYLLELKTGKCRALTEEGGAGYAFCDDGQGILFPALRNDADRQAVDRGEELTVYYRLPLSGGEACEAFRLEAQASKIESLGEGLWLVRHRCDLTRPDLSGVKGEQRAQLLARWKKESEEFHVFDELPFWFDGRGLVNKKRTRLSVYSEKTGAFWPLTAPNMDVGAYAVAPDRKSVVFAGNDVKDWRINEQGLYRVCLQNGETETLIPCRGHEFGRIVFWQGKIVVAGHIHGETLDLRSAKLFTFDEEKGELALALPLDEELGADVIFEVNMGGESLKTVGEDIYLVTSREYRARLSAWRPGERELRPISAGELNVLSFEKAGDSLLAVGFVPGGLQEVYDISGGEARALTGFNAGTFEDAPKGEPLSFVNADGVRIDGWVLKPQGFDPAKTYPAILSVHGGPRGAYCNAFSHEMQVFASRGYFVFYCNPRGSATRGDAFADLSGRWGSIDYDDVMAFTDEVLKAYPAIDEKRLGITGGSYGGFMTNWVIGHTDRFAAAASCRSITYWTGFFGVSDLGGWFDKHEQGGLPWENECALRAHSPLFDLDKVKTPTLIIHSFEDYRCPAPEAYSLYRALIAHGVETRMVLFKGESHGLSRNGKPQHRVRRLEEIAGWFDSHLK